MYSVQCIFQDTALALTPLTIIQRAQQIVYINSNETVCNVHEIKLNTINKSRTILVISTNMVSLTVITNNITSR